VPSEQKQIWAVLRRGDSLQRLSYSLAATFLGRMCLSGDALELGEAKWQWVRETVAFYREVAPLIRDGTFRCVRQVGSSWQHLTGFQIVTVLSPGEDQLLVVWHRFGGSPEEMELKLPRPGSWRIARTGGHPGGLARLQDERVVWTQPDQWTGGVLLLANSV
jgi:alpha-galactosidase